MTQEVKMLDNMLKFTKGGGFILLSFFLFSLSDQLTSQSSSNLLEYVQVSTHNSLGQRYINKRDSLILDLTFPVLQGKVPDSLLSEVPHYKIPVAGANQENQFYWKWPSNLFIVGSIYDGKSIKNLTEEVVHSYHQAYSEVNFKKETYQDLKQENTYLIGNLDNQSYAFWEFLYLLENNKVLRLSIIGLYESHPEKYAEMNGKAQISTLFNSKKQAFLFNPSNTLVDHYIKTFDPISTLALFEAVKDEEERFDTHTYQILTYLYSCVGNQELAQKYARLYTTTSTLENDYLTGLSNLEELEWVGAKEEILKRIDDKSILFINENHNHPQGRTFLKDLLPSLKQKGFTTLIAEGIGNPSQQAYTTVNEVKKGLGFYTNESEFANLLRQAIDLEYQIFSYEANTQTKAEVLKNTKGKKNYEAIRDSLMFENVKDIYNKKLAEKEKMIIFCGHDHLFRNALNANRKLLGMHINEWKGEEVLVVSQSMRPEYYPDSSQWSKVFLAINEHRHPVTPLFKDTPYLGSFQNMIDLVILSPSQKKLPPFLDAQKEEEFVYIGEEDQDYYISIYSQKEVDKNGLAQSVPLKIVPFTGSVVLPINKTDQLLIINKKNGEKIEEIKL